MTETNDNAEIVKTIVSLAHNLGMEVIAEGVETVDQWQKLRALGCQYAQGYLFSRPVPSDKVMELLAADAMYLESSLGDKNTAERMVVSSYQM